MFNDGGLHQVHEKRTIVHESAIVMLGMQLTQLKDRNARNNFLRLYGNRLKRQAFCTQQAALPHNSA